MPAHNAQQFIAPALGSVLSQSYTNIEVIVIDDGSTDTTAEIVQSIAEQDPRVILIQQRNSGVAAARNRAIEASHGEYIAPIDADDLWYPQKIEKQVRCMFEAGTSTGLVYGWAVHIDKDGELMGGSTLSRLSGHVLAALIYRNFVCCASLPLIRRECFQRLGGYNTRLQEQQAHGSEDHELYLRIAEHYRFGLVEEPVVAYRMHASSMSCNHRSMERSHFLVMRQLRRRHPSIPAYVFRWGASRYYMYLNLRSRQAGDRWSGSYYLGKAGLTDLRILLYPAFYRRLLLDLVQIARQLTCAANFLDTRAGPPRRQPALGEISELNNQWPTGKLARLYGRRLEKVRKLDLTKKVAS